VRAHLRELDTRSGMIGADLRRRGLTAKVPPRCRFRHTSGNASYLLPVSGAEPARSPKNQRFKLRFVRPHHCPSRLEARGQPSTWAPVLERSAELLDAAQLADGDSHRSQTPAAQQSVRRQRL